MEKAIVYKIEYWALGKLNALIEKYNKRSAKLNLQPLNFTVNTVVTMVKGEEKKHLEVSFEGDPARIAGWEFLGTIQHAESGNILRSVPGKEISESFRTVKPHCEHCAKYRARKDTFVLVKEEVTKQVGRNCLRDFLGHDPSMALALVDMIRELSEDSDSARGQRIVQPIELLEMAAAMANQIGFSKDTPGMAWNYLFMDKDLREQIKAGKMPDIRVDDAARETAVLAVEWLAQAQMNNFLSNVKAASTMTYITRREATLAAWTVGAYLKAMETDKLAQNKEKFAQAKHIGKIGERLDLTLTLLMVRTIGMTDMGQSLVLYKFQTAENDVVTWLTAANIDAEIGETIKARGTVKQHREYEGVPETSLSRVTVSKRDSETAVQS